MKSPAELAERNIKYYSIIVLQRMGSTFALRASLSRMEWTADLLVASQDSSFLCPRRTQASDVAPCWGRPKYHGTVHSSDESHGSGTGNRLDEIQEFCLFISSSW
jgi:hypothetical protein